MTAIAQVVKNLLERRSRKIAFVSGSITWKECLKILLWLCNGRNVVQGDEIRKYEEEFRNYLHVKHVFSFGAGRMAFFAILKAIGIGEGDEVILPGYTCVVVPDAIIYCGARPVYVDIELGTLTIDVDKIEENITARTKVICAQHTFSSFCDMTRIMEIAKKHNLVVVEDCAHALGAEYDGIKAGSFAHAAFFTTEQSKIISTGMGGVAVTNDDKIAEGIRDVQANAGHYPETLIKKIALQIVLFNIIFHPIMNVFERYLWGAFNKLSLWIVSTTQDELEGKIPKMYPVRLSNIQARVGLSQLGGISKNLAHRRKIAAFYRKKLAELGYVVPGDKDARYNPSYIRFWLLTDNRDALRDCFGAHRIELGEWFQCPIHPMGSLFGNVYYRQGSCPKAEYVAEHNVNLPTHLKIRNKDAERIVQVLSECSQICRGLPCAFSDSWLF